RKTPRGSVFGVLHEWFNEAFEMLTSQVGRLLEDQYLGYFMSGLKPQIRRRVRTLNPQTRMQMMRINKDVDEELREDDEDWRLVSKKGGVEKTGQKDWAGSFQRNKTGSIYSKDPSRVSNSGWSNLNSKAGSSGSNSNSTSSLASTSRKEGELRSGGRGVRSFHREEVAERRAKGLCFKCGGKWHPTQHKCPEKALRDLILGDAETINEDGEIVSMEEVQSEEEEEEEVQCKSMGVLGTMGGHQTMKIAGRIGEVEVLVLIDSGIRMQLDTVNIKVDALVLELGGLDMVLDWNALTMQFIHNGEKVNGWWWSLQQQQMGENQVYPHHHKQEIERQVDELMQAGVIRPSMSAYSSPVILVKKKDKIWRMCVDYSPLNKATIPDKKFIKDYGKLAKPLTGLTKKDKFCWGPEAQVAFQVLKQVMSSPPVLMLPNFNLPFEVECDAAGRGIGAVLM
ncbi:retrotransposon-related protein, partial [Trifolium pratense]